MPCCQVEKRPVAECGDHLDCQSCLSAKDPYCGWCVLEGRWVVSLNSNKSGSLCRCGRQLLLRPLLLFPPLRCGQRWECQRGSVQGQWLWSFNQTQQCLSIQHLSLYNISREEKTDVSQGQELGTDGRAAVCQSASVSAHFLPPPLFLSPFLWYPSTIFSPAVRSQFPLRDSPVWEKERPTPASSRTQKLLPHLPTQEWFAPPPMPAVCPRLATEMVRFSVFSSI